jgi:acetyltransferase-like isoleucine patch superfamily enzyme
MSPKLRKIWMQFWMRHAGLSISGRTAAYIASWAAPPHKKRVMLARMSKNGFIEGTATIHHRNLEMGQHCFIGDRVIILQKKSGGKVKIGNYVNIYRDTIIETDLGGDLTIGDHASIHPRCQINAYVSSVTINKGVMIAPNCAIYPHTHGLELGTPIREQPLVSKGPILIDDEAWLGFGFIVLGGVRIGKGAAVGAGAVVAHDLPDNAIAVGNPAKVIRFRDSMANGAQESHLLSTGSLDSVPKNKGQNLEKISRFDKKL